MVYGPFSQIPPEILSHILSLAWALDSRDDSLARFRFPAVLSQVDRYFNHTVTTTHILWSYLRFTKVADLEHIQDRIQRRSGVLLLDLCIVFDRVHEQDAEEMVRQTIMLNPSRFRRVTFVYEDPAITGQRGGHAESFWGHLNLLSVLQPPLHTTSFSILDKHDRIPSLQLLPPFGPSLRSLTFSNCDFYWMPPLLPQNLESLSVHEDHGAEQSFTITHLLQCLGGRLLQSLRYLSLKGIPIEPTGDTVQDSSVFVSLEGLELELFHLRDTTMLLHAIHAPNLDRLSLKNISAHHLDGRTEATWKSLRFPKLRKLSIGDFDDEHLALISLVENLPVSTREFEITRGLEGGDTPSLWTSLANRFFLGLHHIVADGVSLQSLVEMVAGRCPALQTLQARFRDVSHSRRGEFTQEQLKTYCATLATSAADFRMLKDGGESDINEFVPLLLE